MLDTIVCNSVIDPKLSKIYIFFAVGIVMAIVWYFTFVFLIKKFDIKTPGREESVDNETNYDSSVNDGSSDQNSELFIEGLGGVENIIEVNNCFTRLRIDVNDINKVNKQIISKAKQKGVVIKGNNVRLLLV